MIISTEEMVRLIVVGVINGFATAIGIYLSTKHLIKRMDKFQKVTKNKFKSLKKRI